MNKDVKRDPNYYIEQSDTFNKAFGVDKQRTKPQLVDLKEAQFYIDMLQEELDEMQEAVNNNDLVEIADALCDIQVFHSNAVLGFGLQKHFRHLMDEVHRSNMSKICKTVGEAQETCHRRTLETDKVHIYKKIDDHYVVYYEHNGKVRKSINFQEPNLSKILES